MTRKALDASLRALNARGIEFQNRITDVHDKLFGPKTYGDLCAFTVWSLVNLAIIAAIWPLNDGTFATPQLIAAMCSMALQTDVVWAGHALMWLGSFRTGLDGMDNRIATLEQLCRWQQLVSAESTKPEAIAGSDDIGCLDMDTTAKSKASRLLEHVKPDPLCPCRSCLKGLPSTVFWESFSRVVLNHTCAGFVFFSYGWTPLVYYRNTFWSTGWGIALGTIFLLALTIYNGESIVNKWRIPTAPLIALTTRLYHRASSLALASYLDRARRDLRAPPSPQLNHDTKPEYFTVLHVRYMTAWQPSFNESQGSLAIFVVLASTLYPATTIVSIIINIVSERSETSNFCPC